MVLYKMVEDCDFFPTSPHEELLNKVVIFVSWSGNIAVVLLSVQGEKWLT